MADQKAVIEYIQANFPSLLWALNDPELGPLMQRAQEKGMGPGEFAAALHSTNYWKSTGQSQRAWDEMLNSDPGTAKRKLEQSINTVKEYTLRWGITLDAGQLFALGDQNIRFGWNERDLNLHIGNIFQLNAALKGGVKGPQSGEVGKAMEDSKAISASYGFAASDQQAFQEAIGLMNGQTTKDALKANYALMASSLYPAWKKQFDQGLTLNDMVAPYRQAISADLEVAPEAIDFANNPKWRSVLTYHDPNTKETRPMTLAEAQSYARSQPEFATTNKANELATTATDTFAKGMGAEI